ncbi:MAG: acyl-CoA thioesterase [Deltaproteobacteria bacterium]|nr:acyl-CoA thioesterase [Deltaproteobacteria bacterium]
MMKEVASSQIEVPIRVRYADTDRMGIVYYGTYPMYFEIARSEFLREKGFTYRELEEKGYHLVVTELGIKYYYPATYDDLLVVRTKISELKSRGLKFEYEILKDGKVLVSGYTKHVCVDRNKKPISIPQELFDLLKNAKS